MSSHSTVPEAGHAGVGYERVVERFAVWARTQPDVRAALVVGCRADKAAAADPCLDLEIAVVTDSAREFCLDESWLAELGDWVLSFQTTGPTGLPERRVLDTSGLDVTFVAVSTEAVQRAIASGETFGLGPLLHRNMHVILDQDGLIPRLVARLGNRPPRLPTEAEFLNAVHDFWYHAVRTARQLRQRRLWQAKTSCDGHMKYLLRTVLEWHARGSKDQYRDAGLGDESLEHWADVRAVRELGDAFARYHEDEVWRALFATMNLFGWLARETARQSGFSYPVAGETVARELVRELNAGRS